MSYAAGSNTSTLSHDENSGFRLHSFTDDSVNGADPVGTRNYPGWKLSLWSVSSTIFTILFLNFLVLMALFHALIEYLSKGEHKSHNTYTQPTAEEKKLIPDLNYYYKLLGLQIDRYEVITKDGFVLSMGRIVDPKEDNMNRRKRYPVLLIHGLLQSSGSFCSGGKASLAYYLFKSGYDVWLGNNRCGFEPKHQYMNPSDYRMWEWDIKDMAKFDLVSMVQHVISSSDSKNAKLSLICHSQGTAQGFIALSKNMANLNSKIDCFVALAPAAFGGSLLNEKLFIKIMSSTISRPAFFGVKSFLPIMMKMRSYLAEYRIFGFFSYTMFNYLFDWNDKLWDKEIRNRHFLFSPVYVSVQLMIWWLHAEDGFRKSKCILNHDEQWFGSSTPEIFLVIPRKDKLVNGAMLENHFKVYEKSVQYQVLALENYSHLDVLWATTVIQDIGVPISNLLKKHLHAIDECQ